MVERECLESGLWADCILRAWASGSRTIGNPVRRMPSCPHKPRQTISGQFLKLKLILAAAEHNLCNCRAAFICGRFIGAL